MIGIIKKHKKTQIVGKAYLPFLPYPQSEIINKYNSILRGLCEW